MEEMGHKVFGASSPGRSWASGPGSLEDFYHSVSGTVLPHGTLLGLSLAGFLGFPWPCQTEGQL